MISPVFHIRHSSILYFRHSVHKDLEWLAKEFVLPGARHCTRGFSGEGACKPCREGMARAFFSSWVSRFSHGEGIAYCKLAVALVKKKAELKKLPEASRLLKEAELTQAAERHMRGCSSTLRECHSCEDMREFCTVLNGFPFTWQRMHFNPGVQCLHMQQREAYLLQREADEIKYVGRKLPPVQSDLRMALIDDGVPPHDWPASPTKGKQTAQELYDGEGWTDAGEDLDGSDAGGSEDDERVAGTFNHDHAAVVPKTAAKGRGKKAAATSHVGIGESIGDRMRIASQAATRGSASEAAFEQSVVQQQCAINLRRMKVYEAIHVGGELMVCDDTGHLHDALSTEFAEREDNRRSYLRRRQPEDDVFGEGWYDEEQMEAWTSLIDPDGLGWLELAWRKGHGLHETHLDPFIHGQTINARNCHKLGHLPAPTTSTVQASFPTIMAGVRRFLGLVCKKRKKRKV